MTGRGRETILVVDDDDAVRRLACRILESRGYRVLAAHDGAEAVELSGCFGHAIDLLFTDVRMPRLTGPDLAARLRRHRPGLRVVYASGERPANLDLPADDGSVAFLAKPYSADDLLDVVGRVLAAILT